LMVVIIGILFNVLELFPKVRNKVRNAYLRKLFRSFGAGSALSYNVIVTHPENIMIGHNVSIANGVSLSASRSADIVIGDRCAIAAGVRFVTPTHDYNILPISSYAMPKPIRIGSDVWIGTGAIILPGVTIGDRAVVAAGAVVADDVASDTIVAGVPAKHVKTIIRSYRNQAER
jgi:maltose O-acetyltransferase